MLINPNKNCHENVTIIFPHQEDFFINVIRSYIIIFPHHKRNTMRTYHFFSHRKRNAIWSYQFFPTPQKNCYDNCLNYFHTWRKKQSLNSYPTTLTFYSKIIEFWPFWNPNPNHLGFQNAKNFWILENSFNQLVLAFNCLLTLNSIRNPKPKSSRNPIPHSNRIPNPKSSKNPNPKPSTNPNPNFHCGVRLWFNRAQEIKSSSPKNNSKISAACRKTDLLLCILQWKSKLWQSWPGSLATDCQRWPMLCDGVFLSCFLLLWIWDMAGAPREIYILLICGCALGTLGFQWCFC